ncbi:MAG: cytochrome c [Betaproteobacteria bacterium]|nr:cytochrome c [Betaproteobacteria bacterium]
MNRIALAAASLVAVAAAGAVMSGDRQAASPIVIAQAPAASAPAASSTASSDLSRPDNPGFYASEADLTPSERAGREIWYKATAGNARFHTYVFQQRIGVLVDWYRVLRTDQRDDRFAAYGLINDPGCCRPGTEGCPAKSLDETYGFDWCPGDDTLLKFVGKQGYRDPACDFRDAPPDPNDVHNGKKDQRQSSCDLAFGTSTGALGYRKFPNPRFDAERWLEVNKTAGSWDGYRKVVASRPGETGRLLADGSIEPPFLIGTACGSCHIAFDPLNPPKDPEHPAWGNIKGAIGNQYLRISELLGSGMPVASLEYQVFAHARPGTSDTSAIPTDRVNNPGTMNSILNLHQRPVFENEDVIKWRKVTECPTTPVAGTQCWCEPGRDGKCWLQSRQKETVHHILKGGEDSIGAHEAIQRVYFNIGSCSEQCFVNHLTDLRQLDPSARNYGQTPFEIGQCRRDCANLRAIEDRLGDIVAFLFSKKNHATDLHVARENELQQDKPSARYTYDDLVADLEKRFGAGAVDRGREVFAGTCARCHSSISEAEGGPFKNRDFRAIDPKTGLRKDWLGNDQATPVSEVGTYKCRALHSNHMKGHIFAEYGSETLRARPADPNVKDPADGGRSYYRNISLISLWAHAPFLHNNALGPEICGKPKNPENFFYRSPYVDRATKATLPADQAPSCWAYDPSVEGRFKLYVASMEALLHPDARVPKITRFQVDVPIPVGIRTVQDGQQKQIVGMTVVLPKGMNSAGLGNFDHKVFIRDLVDLRRDPKGLDQRLTKQLGEEEGKQTMGELKVVAVELLKDPEKPIETMRGHPKLVQLYSTCNADIENDGHRFGEDLPEADKKALIAFLATM